MGGHFQVWTGAELVGQRIGNRGREGGESIATSTSKQHNKTLVPATPHVDVTSMHPCSVWVRAGCGQTLFTTAPRALGQSHLGHPEALDPSGPPHVQLRMNTKGAVCAMHVVWHTGRRPGVVRTTGDDTEACLKVGSRHLMHEWGDGTCVCGWVTYLKSLFRGNLCFGAT